MKSKPFQLERLFLNPANSSEAKIWYSVNF